MAKLDPTLRRVLADHRRRHALDPTSDGPDALEHAPSRADRAGSRDVRRLTGDEAAAETGDEAEAETGNDTGSGTAADPDASALIDVALELSEIVPELEEFGFQPVTVLPTSTGTLVLGPMPIARLAELEDLPGIRRIEGPRPLEAELDRSVPASNAASLPLGGTHLDGTGVVVGIVDYGFDLLHAGLRRGDGKTRVAALWDQTDVTGPSPGLPTGAPGVVHTRAEIDELIASWPSPDEDDKTLPVDDLRNPLHWARRLRARLDHGTHVTGIAGGTGANPAGPLAGCRAADTYVGMAPNADLVLVNAATSSSHPSHDPSSDITLVYACNWIFTREPDDERRPAVVNLSLGSAAGPHDGSTVVELALDALLVSPPTPNGPAVPQQGRAIVKSAGNRAQLEGRARKVIAGGGFPEEIHFRMSPLAAPGETHHLEVWYDGLEALTTQVVYKGGLSDTEQGSEEVTPGSETTWPLTVAGQTNSIKISEQQVSVNGSRHISVAITPPPAAPSATSPRRPPPGIWKLSLTNPGPHDVTVDAWIHHPCRGPTFIAVHEQSTTITHPGTAHEVITVGSYAPTNTIFPGSSEQLAASSSRGPDRLGRQKPELVAPGVGITSAVSGEHRRTLCCSWYEGAYQSKSGTSMAAPHVTGAVALLFQADPTLDARQVRQVLIDSARPPHYLTDDDLPDPGWGHGILDVANALASLPEPPAGGGDDQVDPHPLRPAAPEEPARRAAQVPRLGLPSFGTALAELHRQLADDPAGQTWALIASRHLSEIRRVLRRSRPAARCWHRLALPETLAALAQLAVTGDTTLSLEAPPDADRWRDRLLEELDRHGSPALRRDLARHGDLLRSRHPGLLAVLLATQRQQAV